MKVNIKRLKKLSTIPTYGTDGAGCFDLYACFDDVNSYEWIFYDSTNCNRFVEEHIVIPTGLSFEIPKGYCMLIFSRSGHGFKNNVRLSNCVGVIDSDYRGEVMVKLTQDSIDCDFTVRHGDKIAQGMIIPVDKVQFVLQDELSDTERGSNGFGSTGD